MAKKSIKLKYADPHRLLRIGRFIYGGWLGQQRLSHLVKVHDPFFIEECTDTSNPVAAIEVSISSVRNRVVQHAGQVATVNKYNTRVFFF